MNNARIAGIIFYLMPTLIGWLVIRCTRRTVGISLGGTIAQSFSIGALLIFGITLLAPYVSKHIGPFQTASITRYGLMGILALSVLSLPWKTILSSLRSWVGPAIVIVTGALLGQFIFHRATPYPYPLNWDLFEHQLLMTNIAHGHISYITSHLSDTFRFDGYSTLFHTLGGVSQWLATAVHTTANDVFPFWWMAEILLTIAAAIASYLLTLHLTARKSMALFASFLSSMVFESTIVFGAYFLIPQTLTALLFAFAMSELVKKSDRPIAQTVMWIMPICITLFFMHYIVGTAAIACMIAWIFLSKTQILKRTDIYLLLITIVPIAIIIGLEVISTSSNILSINMNEASSAYFYQSPITKLVWGLSWYGIFGAIVAGIGIIAGHLTLPKEKMRPYMAITCIVLACVLAQAPYMLKFYTLGRYLLPTYMAIGIVTILMQMRSAVLQTLSVICIVVYLAFMHLANIPLWQTIFSFTDSASIISREEVQLADSLNKLPLGKTTYMISDPATSYILEPITGIESQGGAYMDKSVRTVLGSMRDTSDTASAYEKLWSINDRLVKTTTWNRLFIVSARYLAWQRATPEDQQSIAYDIWRPTAFTLRDLIEIDRYATLLGVNPIITTREAAVFFLPKPIHL